MSFDAGGIEIMAETKIMESLLLSQSNDTKRLLCHYRMEELYSENNDSACNGVGSSADNIRRMHSVTSE